jgi:hypothetical protein
MKPKIATLVITVLAILLITSHFAAALPIQPERIAQIAKLNDGIYSQAFGASVAISGDTIAIGDPADSQLGGEVGAVTIYQSDPQGGWLEIAHITPSVVAEGMRFGSHVALSGDRLVVGAPGGLALANQAGSAYIYERNQGGSNAWGEVVRLTASDVPYTDNYGWGIATSGNTVVIGAYTRPMGGKVYIYERDAGGPGAWGETAQLLPDEPGFQACFGVSVDLDEDLLAIGAYGGGDYAGYVYVFQRVPSTNQWQRLTRFRAADTYAYHYFGYSVALENWTILTGAPGADSLTGSAYIFTSDPSQPGTWTEQIKLSASDGAFQDYFGIELALSGEHAWIGAPLHANRAGTAYVFDRNYPGEGQWGEEASIAGNDTLEGDEFGYWVDIEGQIAVAGSPGNAPTGSVYLFDLNQPWKTHLPLVIR